MNNNAIIALLTIHVFGEGMLKDAPWVDNAIKDLAKHGMIETTHTGLDISEKGGVFIDMIQGTPLPVPTFKDPRE